jgi:hypothetical protein
MYFIAFYVYDVIYNYFILLEGVQPMFGEEGRPTVSAARTAATIPSVSDLGRRKTAPLTASVLSRHFLF